MATDTTTQQIVDVVTPAAGESVTEGTILEWHVKVGEQIKADDTIVEISTDKVDVELPSPATGTVTEILVAEGDTVTVGQVIARIAVGNGARPGGRRARRSRGERERAQSRGRRRAAPTATETAPARRPPRRRPPSRRAGARHRRRRHPRRRRVGQRGDDPRMARQGRRCRSRPNDTIVEISTDKVDLELPAPATGTVTELLVAEGDTVTVGQVIARIALGAGAPRRRRERARAPARAHRVADARHAGARGHARLARRSARRRGRGSRPREGRRAAAPPGGSPSPTCSGPRAANGATSAEPATAGRRSAADARRRGGARSLHGAVALDPDRDELPDPHRHHARRPPPAAQGRAAQGLLHPPDRLRDRARGRRRCR